MTSTPVKDASSLMNFVQPRGVPTSGQAGTTGSFGQAMNRATDRMNGKPMELASQTQAAAERADRANGRKEVTGPEKAGEKQSASGQAGRTANDKAPPTEQTSRTEQTAAEQAAAAEQAVRIDAETAAKLEEAGMEAVRAVAEETGLSEEEVLAAMEELGLIPAALLEPRNLTDLVLRLSDADALTLMTDGALYAKVNSLLDTVAGITEQLKQATGLTDAQLATALTGLKAGQGTNLPTLTAEPTETAEVPEGEAPENINPEGKTKEAAANSQADAERDITIVVEKDGVVTEVTARADDKGNLQAVKEVVTTPAEQTAVTADSGQTGGQSGQPSEQNSRNSEQEMSGRSSLLEQLLLNRTHQAPEAVQLSQSAAVLAQPDTEQIMRQIMDFMKVQLKPEINHLEMQLNPANLGKVYVEIAAKEGVITAQLTTQNETVKAALESQLVELKENMRAQGIKVEAVEVNVQSQAFNSSLWQGQEGNGEANQQNRKNTRRINLNELDLEELPEEMTGEEKLAAEIMAENGGTVDLTA